MKKKIGFWFWFHSKFLGVLVVKLKPKPKPKIVLKPKIVKPKFALKSIGGIKS